MFSNAKRKLLTFLPAWTVIWILVSCTKPTEDQKVTQTDLIYYYCYSDKQSFPQNNDSLDCRRICFDLANEKIVWNKKNDRAPIANFLKLAEEPWSKGFDNGNDIVTIFPTADVPSAFQGGTLTNAIYFQKVNKSTGDQLLLKQIVSAAEIVPSTYFTMSQVISNGTHYYFWLGNGNVYCFNQSGDLVWKKGPFAMTNAIFPNTYFGYTYLYYDAGKIYVTSPDNSVGFRHVTCIDALTGQQSWVNVTVPDPLLKEFLFTNNRMVQFSKFAVGVVCDKANGNQIDGYSSSAAGNVYPVSVIDNTTILYSGSKNNVPNMGILSLSPIRAYLPQNIDFQLSGDCKKAEAPSTKVYSVSIKYGTGKLTLACIDPKAGTLVQWVKTYPYSLSPALFFYVYDYYIKDDKLYVLANFEIENNTAVVNSTKTYSMLIFSLSGGDVIKQISNLPAGRFSIGGAYNLLHD